MCRDVLRLAEVGMDEQQMRRLSIDIFEMRRLKLCNDSEVNRNYLSGTRALDRKQSWLRKESYGDRDMLLRACSASSLAYSVVQVV